MSQASTQKPASTLISWKAAWRHAAFRVEVGVTLLLFVIVLTLFSRFVQWIEFRQGVVLYDPIIATVPVRDFTWPIFMLIYGGLVVAFATLIAHPIRFIIAVQSYIVIVCIRFVAMYAAPLDPPAGIIPLVDPFVQFIRSGSVLTKDLFFSGHTAALTLLSVSARRGWLRVMFTLCTITVAVLIVWQHVHYTADVLVAPFIAYTSYRLVSLFHVYFLRWENEK